MPVTPHAAGVHRGAFVLGLAGLLPAAGTVALIALGRQWGAPLAFAYALLILSFLGGMWWGFAMRRGARQTSLACIAVVPSLAGFALVVAFAGSVALPWLLVAAGVMLLLTLPVDRHLVRTGDAPAAWMRLRVPLSTGLGALTIVAGALSGR